MFGGIFNLENPFWSFVGRLGDIILLNLLWTVTSLPLFTIGASTTALYTCTIAMVRDKDSSLISKFFTSFKENFKKATIIWIILALVLAVIVFDINFFMNLIKNSGSAFRFIVVTLGVFFSFIWYFTALYIFPLQSKFENGIGQSFKVAILMAIRHLPSTAIMLISNAILLFLAYFLAVALPQMFGFVLLFGFPVIAFVNSMVLSRVFLIYENQ